MTVKSLSSVLAAFVSVAAMASVANAATLNAQYFQISENSQMGGDFGICCSSPPATLPVVSIGAGLGPNKMPVTELTSGSGAVVDQDPTTHEILWWTPSAATGITASTPATGLFQLNQLNNMYAPASTGTNNTNFFETAILTGTLTGTGKAASISLIADDDALVYVDGAYVGGLAGVHGNESTTIDLGALTGQHSLEIFYADRAQVGADLEVGVAGAAVPEPVTWAFMLFGFGGIGAAMRQRRRKAAAAAA
jgi:hypothetical protein